MEPKHYCIVVHNSIISTKQFQSFNITKNDNCQMCTVSVVYLIQYITCQNTKKGTYKDLSFFPIFFIESYRMVDIFGF